MLGSQCASGPRGRTLSTHVNFKNAFQSPLRRATTRPVFVVRAVWVLAEFHRSILRGLGVTARPGAGVRSFETRCSWPTPSRRDDDCHRKCGRIVLRSDFQAIAYPRRNVRLEVDRARSHAREAPIRGRIPSRQRASILVVSSRSSLSRGRAGLGKPGLTQPAESDQELRRVAVQGSQRVQPRRGLLPQRSLNTACHSVASPLLEPHHRLLQLGKGDGVLSARERTALES